MESLVALALPETPDGLEYAISMETELFGWYPVPVKVTVHPGQAPVTADASDGLTVGEVDDEGCGGT